MAHQRTAYAGGSDWNTALTEEDSPPQLIEVRLLGIPLALQQRAAEHNDGLRRECQLLVEQGHVDPSSIPARLVALAADLDRRFESFTASSRSELEKAVERGEVAADLSIRVPSAVKPAAAQFKELLAEADAYCETGEHLLTLAPTADIVAFRNWVLDEFIQQADGRDPIPWAEVGGASPSN